MQTLEIFDRMLKFEVILDNMHNVLFYGSFAETILLGLTFVFLLLKPKTLVYWMLHLPHVVHAFFGLLLGNKIPRSDHVIEAIKPKKGDEENRSQSLATFETETNAKIYEFALFHHEKCEPVLKRYFTMIIVCLVGDLLDVMFQAFRTRKTGDELSEFILLCICFIFLIIDLAYPLWVYHVSLKVPLDW